MLAHWGTWKAQLSGRLAIPLSAPPFLSTHDNGQTTTHTNNVTKNLAADALCASPSLLLRNRSFLTWKSYEYNIANRIPKAQLAFQSAVAPPSLGFLAFCLSTPISTPTQTALAKVVARTRSRRQQKNRRQTVLTDTLSTALFWQRMHVKPLRLGLVNTT